MPSSLNEKEDEYFSPEGWSQGMRGKSLLLLGPKELQWTDEELPIPSADQITVRTICGSISMGTELPQYRGDDRINAVRPYPRMTGYESLGEVVERGPNVRHLELGQRVIGFWGHRTHAAVNGRRVIPVPEGVDSAVALLTILSCDAAKGVLKAKPSPTASALITGAGAMGLLALHFLKHRMGVQRVAVCEPESARRELARSIGADTVYSPDKVVFPGNGYELGVECSGRNAAFSLLQAMAIPNGTIVVLSDGNIEGLALSPDFHRKELRVLASSDGYDYHEHSKWFFSTIIKDTGSLHRLFQAQIPAKELEACFDDLAAERNRPVKVLVVY